MKEFGLSKSERIKSRKLLEVLFSQGEALYSRKSRFKAVFYLFKKSNQPGVKVVFAVHKRAGNAVWRNRVKRLMRETYRLNKNILYASIPQNTLLLLALSPSRINQRNYRIINLSDVAPDIINLLEQVRVKLPEK